MKMCNEVMTKNPVCCLPDDLVTKAAQLMKSEHVGSIPVVEIDALVSPGLSPLSFS